MKTPMAGKSIRNPDETGSACLNQASPAGAVRSIPAAPVVITGAGLATCLGADRWTTWRAVLAGRCGLRPLTALESTLPQAPIGGQAADLSVSKNPALRIPENRREVQYLRHVVDAALEDARLSLNQPQFHPQYTPSRCSVLMGTTLHGMRNGGQFLRSGRFQHLEGFLANHTLQNTIGNLALGGTRITTCSACSSGLAAIILGIRMLQEGEADLVLAGGYDPISEYAFAGFRSMRLESQSSVRPFSRLRDGMKVAEGYACLVLERLDDARRRGANVLAQIAGYGEACDAFHLSKPHPEGRGAAEAMRAALTQAGIEPNQVDLIVAHATGTPDNDAAEFAALEQVFEDSLSTVSATAFKSHLGHALGGAGAVELVLSAMTLVGGVIPPCADLDRDELEFCLPLQTGEPRRRDLRHTLNLSLGFGGANASVILAKVESGELCEINSTLATSPSTENSRNVEAVGFGDLRKRGSSFVRKQENESQDAANRAVLITGLGVVLPGAVGNEAFLDRLNNGCRINVTELPSLPQTEELDQLVNAQRARRMSQYARLCIAAVTVAYRDAGIIDPEEFGGRCALFAASTHGPAEFCEAYYRQIIAEGLDAANPSLFAEGVPNVGSAHLSTHFRIRGFCQTVIGTRTAGLDALRLAANAIRSGAWDQAVVTAADEFTPLIVEAYERLAMAPVGTNESSAVGDAPGGLQSKGRGSRVSRGAGAACLILESAGAAKARGARPFGEVLNASAVSWPTWRPRLGAERVARLLENLGPVEGVLFGDVGDHWPDRIGRAGLRRWARRRNHIDGSTTVAASSVYRFFPDVCSALPLSDLAATLLLGRLPSGLRPDVGRMEGVHVANGQERDTAVSLLATDFAATASGARIRLLPRC